MTIITVSRASTPDEIAVEMDRRGAVIEHLKTTLLKTMGITQK